MGAEAQIDPELRARLRDHLAHTHGARLETIEVLPGQLGARRFYRVRLSAGPAETLIARVDAPEDPRGRPSGVPPEPPLEPIRALLERHGLPVPRSFGRDPGDGDAPDVEWLEDLGDRSLAAAFGEAGPEERRRLYTEACGIVPRLQAIADPGGVEAFGRRLDAGLIAFKADLFARFALRVGGRTPAAGEADVVRDAFAAVAEACRGAPQRLAHRDFQSANLHVVPGRGLVMIDVQGAFLAPPEYDLVCLLRDSYVAVPEAEIQLQLAAVRPQLPDAPDAETFARRFDLLTLSRKGKDLARFQQAAEERGDPRFLRYASDTLRTVADAAARAAERERRLGDFAQLCRALEEAACAP